MEIIKGRSAVTLALLCTACASLAAAANGAAYCFIIIFCLIFSASAAYGLYFVCRKEKRPSSYRVISAAAVALLFLAFAVRAAFYYGSALRRPSELAGENKTVSGRVLERLYSTSYSTVYRVRVSGVDGKSCNMTGRLTCEYVCDLQADMYFTLTGAEVAPAPEEDISNLSEGLLLLVQSCDENSVRISGFRKSFSSQLLSCGRKLKARLKTLVGGDEGDLCASVIFADKSLSNLIRRDFRRSGISHILAVSGLHISIIAGFAGFVLSRLRIGRRLRCILISAMLILYLFIIGFPAGAVRGCIMLIMSYAGFFAGADSDGINSLAVAVFIILFIWPAAVLDTGFILTVTATLGIVTALGAYNRKKLTERNASDSVRRILGEREKGKLTRLAAAVGDSAASRIISGLSVAMLTLLPVSVCIGEYSLVSVPANALFALPATLLVSLSVLLVIFSYTPFSGFLAYYCRLTASFFIRVSGKISALRDVSYSLEYCFVPYILIPAAVITCIFLTVKLKHREYILLPVICSVLALGLCTGLYNRTCNTVTGCLYTLSGSECISLTCKNRAVLIDITSGSYPVMRDAMKEARTRGITEAEAVVLTHYHVRHESSLSLLFSNYYVRRLWLPYPSEAEDAAVALKLASLAEQYGCECCFYNTGSTLRIFGGASLNICGTERIKRSTHPVAYMKITGKDGSLLYIGSSAWESTAEDFLQAAEECTTFVFGSHGPVAKTGAALAFSSAERVMVQNYELLESIVPKDFQALERIKNLPVRIYGDRLLFRLKPE